jgi:hypothetical protein
LLDLDLLDHRLDNPVDIADFCQVAVESARLDPAGHIDGEKRVGLQLAGSFQPLAGDLVGQVEQQHRDASIRKMGRDLRAHRAGAQDRHGLNRHCHRFRISQPSGEIRPRLGPVTSSAEGTRTIRA